MVIKPTKTLFLTFVLPGLLLACAQLTSKPKDEHGQPTLMTESNYMLSLLKFIPWSSDVPENFTQFSQPNSGGMIELPGPKTKIGRTTLRFQTASGNFVGEIVSPSGAVLDKLIELGIPSPDTHLATKAQADGFVLDPLANVLSYDGNLLLTDAPGGFYFCRKGQEQHYLPLVSAGRAEDGKAFFSGFENGKVKVQIEANEQIELVVPQEVEARRIFFVVAVEKDAVWVKGDADLMRFDRAGNMVDRIALDDQSYLENLAPKMWELNDVAAAEGSLYLSCNGPSGIAVLQIKSSI